MASETFSLNYSSQLRILVVDDDPTCLSIVAATLKKYKYQVVTAKHAKDALCTLRIEKQTLNLVVSDVHMPDMNGFELQQTITQEFNLPVVLMSADKRLENGMSSFFISKPVRPEDVRNLWQFAAKKGSDERVIQEENGNSEDNNSVTLSKRNKKKVSKRKEESNEEEGDNSHSSSTKKAKVIWTNSLHSRFLEAIRTIGLERSVPKKILEFMNVPGLTRENVASHLQKYRMFLRKVSDASYQMQYSEGSSSKATFSSPARSFRNFQYQKQPGQYFPGSFTNRALITNDNTLVAQSGLGQSQLASMSNVRNEGLIYLNNDHLAQTNHGSAPSLFQGHLLDDISSLGGLGYSSLHGLSRINGTVVAHPEARTLVGSSNITPQVVSTSFADQLNQKNYFDSNIRTTLYCNNGVLNNSTTADIAADDHVSQANNNISLDQLLAQYLGVCSPTIAANDKQLSGQSLIADSLQSNIALPEIKEQIHQSASFNPAHNLPSLDCIVGTQQPLDQEGDLNDILQHQLNIQNQAQSNGVGNFTSSTFYGGQNHWENNHALALDNLQLQQGQDFVRDASSQFNNTLFSTEYYDVGDEDDDNFLESLLASF